jgi:hypothetical protein
MEANRSLEILKSLSEGIDPFTGEIFPEDSPYRHPETRAALSSAIDALVRLQSRLARQEKLPGNAGKAWTEAEDDQLATGFDAGKSFKELSEEHGRTEGAIKSRLLKLGKITA